MIAFRDLAIKDQNVFNEYRNKKLECMAKDQIEGVDYMMYKLEKGKVAAKHLSSLKKAEDEK